MITAIGRRVALAVDHLQRRDHQVAIAQLHVVPRPHVGQRSFDRGDAIGAGVLVARHEHDRRDDARAAALPRVARGREQGVVVEHGPTHLALVTTGQRGGRARSQHPALDRAAASCSSFHVSVGSAAPGS
ncbi:MAG: hypothetical protein U0168_29760 [Nannocystaceae bacterium]